MSTYKEISPSRDIKVRRSYLNQLVDMVEEDVSGSNSRKRYAVFTTGTVGGSAVTSSLFQTVYDQDYTLQTANPMFDITVGLFSGSNTVTGSSTGVDTSGKVLFMSESLMMREKVANYRQFAQLLKGDADARFVAPLNSLNVEDNIDEALFIGFKRLFSRDKIKRSTFAMKMFMSAAAVKSPGYNNLTEGEPRGPAIFTDAGASSNMLVEFGGEVGNIVNAANTSQTVGQLYYQQGIAVFDIKKIISGSQLVSGSVSACTKYAGGVFGIPAGKVSLGIGNTAGAAVTSAGVPGTNSAAKFIPDLMVSASIDDIVDHFASVRFGSGSLTAMTFQNITNINSTLVFCRATADEFNYSSNPTYVDRTTNKIKVIEPGQEDTQLPFSYVTTVGLYDENDNLIAVAKLSRPVEKNQEKDLTFRVRLDF